MEELTELYNSKAFWDRRLQEQYAYVKEISKKEFHWEGRRHQLMVSADDVLEIIMNRIIELRYGKAF